MATYNISFCNGYSIEKCQSKNINRNSKVKFENDFGQIYIKNNSVEWIYSPFKPIDTYITIYKKEPCFLKKESFECFKLGNNNTWEKIDEFEGTFIDAFKYINQNFGRI